MAYLGVDTNVFKPKNVKQEIDILFVGTKDPIDGYALLKESLNIIDNKLNVVLVPGDSNKILSLKEMVTLYQKSKIVVCLAVNEPFGLVPLEAMACAVPVIAVSEGGYAETVIDGKTGFLINREKDDLAKNIKLLLDNNTLAEKLGENGRREVLKNWAWAKRGKELEKVLLSFYGNINNHS